MIDKEYQTQITRAVIKSAVLMMEFGAESILVEQTALRLGKALGVDYIEMSLIPSAIVLTTLYNKKSITTTRRVHHKPINMTIVCEVQDMIKEVEKSKKDAFFVLKTIKEIKSNRYNHFLVSFMVGLSCAAFSHISGGDIYAFFITFLASTIAMHTRYELAKRRFTMVLTFMIVAFTATLIASLSLYFSKTPNIALASSVLLLFPGFPFINSLLDALKGYLSMGWGRWLQASLLTFSAVVGIILAMSILNIQGW